MKNYIFLLLFPLLTLGAINNVNAQVTIGELNPPDVTLDVRGKADDPAVSDGVLIPRLSGNELAAKDSKYGDPQHSTLVYVTAAATSPRSGKTSKVDAAGFYYYDAKFNSGAGIWEPLSQCQPAELKKEWFYMPPCPIDVTDEPNKDPINLFQKFIESITPTLSISSVTGETFSDFYDITGLSGEDFDYYVVGYDTSLFDNISIDEFGVMTYEIIGSVDYEKSYINIIFVRK